VKESHHQFAHSASAMAIGVAALFGEIPLSFKRLGRGGYLLPARRMLLPRWSLASFTSHRLCLLQQQNAANHNTPPRTLQTGRLKGPGVIRSQQCHADPAHVGWEQDPAFLRWAYRRSEQLGHGKNLPDLKVASKEALNSGLLLFC
jgi:hypothetical protein